AAVAARSDEPGHDLGDAQAGGTQQRRRVPRAPGEVDPTRGVRFRDDGREDVRGPAIAPAGGLYLGAHGVVGDREVAPSRLETWADERRDVVGDVPDALLPARQVGRPRMRGGGGALQHAHATQLVAAGEGGEQGGRRGAESEADEITRADACGGDLGRDEAVAGTSAPAGVGDAVAHALSEGRGGEGGAVEAGGGGGGGPRGRRPRGGGRSRAPPAGPAPGGRGPAGGGAWRPTPRRPPRRPRPPPPPAPRPARSRSRTGGARSPTGDGARRARARATSPSARRGGAASTAASRRPTRGTRPAAPDGARGRRRAPGPRRPPSARRGATGRAAWPGSGSARARGGAPSPRVRRAR